MLHLTLQMLLDLSEYTQKQNNWANKYVEDQKYEGRYPMVTNTQHHVQISCSIQFEFESHICGRMNVIKEIKKVTTKVFNTKSNFHIIDKWFILLFKLFNLHLDISGTGNCPLSLLLLLPFQIDKFSIW